MPSTNSGSLPPSSAGRVARPSWTRPLTAPFSVVQTFSAVAVLLAVAVTVLLTSRVAGLLRSGAFDELSAG